MTDPPVRLFPGRDGAELAYREIGDGRPLVLSTASPPTGSSGCVRVPRPTFVTN
ncbi:hypothetical protein OHB01_19000 [Microbispora hainanensis]|jgi:hypothetical protein|uniref:Uncharacterized protein n=1 Tax=Microbispora hainanensis TaxID=568844 RepID=A0ABZ1T187_9ACTN|nr:MULTISPECIES: hypothetical protein [Microbispora]